MGMQVWIDQELCTGDGLCEDICPDSFQIGDDNLAYVKEDKQHFGRTQVIGTGDDDRSGAAAAARVFGEDEEGVIEAAEQCPGECIFIEVGD